MITVIHGDNTVQSRAYLMECVSSARKKGDVVSVEAKTLNTSSLEELLGSQALFSPEKTIVIEGLFGLPRGKQKSAYMKMIAETPVDAILWDGKVLKQTDLKAFAKATVRGFKASSSVFAFADSIFPGNGRKSIQLLEKAEKSDGIEMCFAMLARQIRLLITVKDGDVSGVPPFAVSRLNRQAKAFEFEALFRVYERLTEIDEAEKRSSSPLTLRQQLDLLLLEL